MFSGVERTLDLPITEAQLDAWCSGTLCQDAFPQLSADDREFVMTGVTAQEWDREFGDDEDDQIHDRKGEAGGYFKGGTEYEPLSRDDLEDIAKEYDR